MFQLIRNENKELAEENSNKNTMLASTQRDYIAGEVSRDLTRRILLPEKITKAHEDLVKQFNNRYPSNVVISLSLYQTERDILLNQATCQVTVVFPDVFETWNCTIIASRNGTTEA